MPMTSTAVNMPRKSKATWVKVLVRANGGSGIRGVVFTAKEFL